MKYIIVIVGLTLLLPCISFGGDFNWKAGLKAASDGLRMQRDRQMLMEHPELQNYYLQKQINELKFQQQKMKREMNQPKWKYNIDTGKSYYEYPNGMIIPLD